MDAAIAKQFDTLYLALLQQLPDRNTASTFIASNDELRRLKASLKSTLEKFKAPAISEEERNLLTYAVVAWVDDSVIRVYPDWKDMTLEAEFNREFKAHDRFFENADKARELGFSNAVEAYFLSFMLGYHGRLKSNTHAMQQWQKTFAASIKRTYKPAKFRATFDATPRVPHEELAGGTSFYSALFALLVSGLIALGAAILSAV